MDFIKLGYFFYSKNFLFLFPRLLIEESADVNAKDEKSRFEATS